MTASLRSGLIPLMGTRDTFPSPAAADLAGEGYFLGLLLLLLLRPPSLVVDAFKKSSDILSLKSKIQTSIIRELLSSNH